ncbi:hypothetical protein SARC_07531 [Sphaeroforma arctica JP610]|uniref:protein-disulfide reductase n=1 Tax=Sphaeroforma arctica JP610 TaxID=667725 RepID=A0A0L0FVZ1_9EUKA|nr:hypothetical protein SARC_07531 [Sphaeroforma arctica JP610]KNC80088.1 hypothetical protein SARC_07531 [Sphaeroforma arctica JP610]|eukprot:XP_014153990.1 hypothetical protein SARC_07531 [Sphaeroforma arctica JP610]
MSKEDYECNGNVCVLKPKKGASQSTGTALPDLSNVTLLDCSGSKVDKSVLKDKETNKDDFIVLFVSMDKSEEDMMEYVEDKNFVCIKYDEDLVGELPSAFTVTMVPTLAIISPENECITTWGRSAIDKNAENCIAEWKQGRPGVSWMQLLKFW